MHRNEANSEHIYQYRVFGLNVDSSIELPELCGLDQGVPTNTRAVQISEVCFEPVIFNRDLFVDGFRFKNRELFIRIEDVGYFHIADRNTIYFERDPDQASNVVQDRDIRVFLLGSCLGAVLQLRGFLPLHASVISIGDAGVAFMGHSGAGKSTTIALLSEQGHQVLTDDVAVVDLGSSGSSVLPGYPQMKLNADSAEALAIPQSSLQWINRFRSKYSRRCDDVFSTEARLLSSIFVLKTEPNLTKVKVKQLVGIEKFAAIMQNTYRQFFHVHFGIQQRISEQVAKLCTQCDVYELSRPTTLSEASLKETRDAIYLTTGIK